MKIFLKFLDQIKFKPDQLSKTFDARVTNKIKTIAYENCNQVATKFGLEL